ncbi:MAG: YaiI/YqxD family protein, partial [Gemmatimonadota bacterium]
DADSCPVKDEVYRVARRYELEVQVVAATWLRLPDDPLITLEVVRETGDLDVADDRIVEQVDAGDIVISDDILLAQRCLDKGAHPLTTRGKEFTPGSIGEAVATRELMAGLREAGAVTGGPSPFTKSDRSQFLQQLDEIVNRVQRRNG